MKKNLMVCIGIIIIAIVVVVGFSRYKSKQSVQVSPALKIGVSLPLTGSIAHLGESAQKGVELASEELKRDQPNLNLEYYIEDNAFTGNAAVSAYRKLKDADNIDAIITATSPATLATEPLAKQDSILQMGIFASTPKYSTPNDLSFRIFPRSEKEAEAIIAHIEKAKFQRLGVIYINNDFGQAVFNAISSKLLTTDRQLKIVSVESYVPDTTDFKTQLVKIKSENPQVLVMISTAQDVVNIMRQAQTIGLQAQFLASSAASDPAVLSTAPQTQGLLMTEIFDPESTDKTAQSFISGFKQKFGTTPDLWAVQGYDAYKLTALALEKCGRDGDCIKSYLFGLKDYPTVLGSLTFDVNGDPDYKYFMKKFVNGQFERVRE